MEFSQIEKRALEVRELYDKLNTKHNKPWTPLNRTEGLVGDVGDLMKIVMAKEGYRQMDNIDEKLKHELSDCLWSIIVIANSYNINLGEEFLKTMDELEERVQKEL